MTRQTFSLTRLLACIAIYAVMFAVLARYGWQGLLAATTIATPLCDLLLTARRVFNLGIELVAQTALFINPSESVACASHMSVKVSTVRVGIH